MACRGFWECLLKLLNFLLALAGLAMVGYGVYLLVEFLDKSPPSGSDVVPAPPVAYDPRVLKLGRPVLMLVTLSESFLDKLPQAWFIYVFIGIGVIVFVISIFGCVGAVARNRCCLSSYSVLLILLILVELGATAFIFFDPSWKNVIPADKSGDFEMIYSFLKENWKIAKWVALGGVVLEALVFSLALIVRSANKPADYDSDDDYIPPRGGSRQPLLINRQAVPATGVPVSPSLDQRPSRNDAWSQRLREKYGLDKLKFTYNNPSAPSVAEERRGCAIL